MDYKKNLLLISDHPHRNENNWPFAVLCTERFNVKVFNLEKDSNHKHGVMRVLLDCLRVSLYCFINRNKYDACIFFLAKKGIVLSIFARLFKIKLPKIILLDFIMFQRPSFVLTIFEKILVRYALGRSVLITVPAKELVDYYKIYHFQSKIYYLPTPLPPTINIKEEKRGEIGDYAFCGGYSLRDWPTVLKAATYFHDTRFVVCGSSNDKALLNLKWPENVSVFIDLPYYEFYEILSKAKFVVLAIADKHAPAGFLVLFHALEYGKAVISSKTAGLVDCINHGHNGLLFSHKDADDLIEKINLLQRDSNLIVALGLNAKRTLEYFSDENYFQRFCQILDAEGL
ncbi:MAG: glycosyltransferase [Candidatus Brocadiaceae bacterium]|nr:glycosyltransferase [Candidatus Brocadiaceae bacterium]